MIEIDRQAGSSVQEQIARQLRYLIASEHFAVGDTLPGTRRLAEEADVSFHTVRKAYQQLQQEGLLETSPGKGYVVQERSALDQEARLERGADVMRGALREMIGMGLRPSEISRLARKQLRRVGATRELELLFVAPHQNQARACAEQVSAHLERPVEPALPADLAEHEDADYVFAPHALVHPLDLLDQVLLVVVQAFLKLLVACRQDLHGQERRVLRPVDRQAAHRHAARHLHDAE